MHVLELWMRIDPPMVIGPFLSIKFSHTAGNDSTGKFRPCPDSRDFKHPVTSLHLDHYTYILSEQTGQLFATSMNVLLIHDICLPYPTV
jgi:hypothetical protein